MDTIFLANLVTALLVAVPLLYIIVEENRS